MENSIFMGIGLLFGAALFYTGFWVGRKTGYEDKNVVPPPSPLSIKTPLGLVKKQEPQTPPGWVTDDSPDPPMVNFRPGGEL